MTEKLKTSADKRRRHVHADHLNVLSVTTTALQFLDKTLYGCFSFPICTVDQFSGVEVNEVGDVVVSLMAGCLVMTSFTLITKTTIWKKSQKRHEHAIAFVQI